MFALTQVAMINSYNNKKHFQRPNTANVKIQRKF